MFSYVNAIAKMSSMQPWLPLLIAANIMGRSVDKTLRWVENSKLRARRVDSEYTSTGEAIEVYRDDCIHLLQCLDQKTATLTLIERDIASLDCEGMNGEEIHAYLKVKGLSAAEADAEATTRSLNVLKEIPPSVAMIPPINLVDYEMDPALLHKRLCAVEQAMQTMLAHYGGVGKMDHLGDEDIEELLSQAVSMMIDDLTLTRCTQWIHTTRQLSQEHFSRINSWARINPKLSSGFVDPGYPAYFVIVQASFRVRALLERWPGSDREGTGLYALRASAILEHERLQKLTFGQMQFDAFMRLQHPATIPVGHSVTDNYILNFVRKRRIRSLGGQKT